MPPFAVVSAEAAGFHDGAEVVAVFGFGGGDSGCAVVGDGVHEVVVAAHGGEFAGGEVVEGEVDGAAAAVAGFGGDVAVGEHVGSGDVGVVPGFGAAVFGLLCPADEVVHGALGAVAVPEQQAVAEGFGFFLGVVQGGAQGCGADDPVGEVAVDGFAGEVVPGGVFGVPAQGGHDLVDEGEIVVHGHFPVRASDTVRSITSASGTPAAAIIRG
ncbi:hypothetical protein KIPE111705_46955 [Kibdelosporangium persicum]